MRFVVLSLKLSLFLSLTPVLFLTPNVNATSSSAIELASISVQAAASGTFYVNGHFSPSIDMDLLIDTGSSFTIIDEKSAKALLEHGAMEYKRSIVGTMADGSEKHVDVYQVKEMFIGSCRIAEFEAVSLGKHATPVLGINALSSLSPFSLDIANKRLLVNCPSTLDQVPLNVRADVE